MKKIFIVLIIIIILLTILKFIVPYEKITVFTIKSAEDKISAFASKHGIDISEWSDELVSLLNENPEAEEFVLNYPLKKNISQQVVITENISENGVPLFLQWDTRWGYQTYGSSVLGLSGCGPVCLSMVCVYLFNDASYHPGFVADFSIENGYCVPGSGSSWSLIPEGGKALGITVTEIPLDKDRILRNLEAGNPIICVVGPGDFTSEGHFIVLAKAENGKIKINDPNSVKNSKKLWNFDDIKDQILNLWVCSL